MCGCCVLLHPWQDVLVRQEEEAWLQERAQLQASFRGRLDKQMEEVRQ